MSGLCPQTHYVGDEFQSELRNSPGGKLLIARMTNESPGASQPHLLSDCDKLQRLVWLYLDGELAPQAASKLQRHLRDCAACSAVMRFERAFLSAIRAALRSRGNEELAPWHGGV